MSSRVQKGNTVFRPVTKARTRLGSEVRQLPSSPDARQANSSVISHNASAMPPPSATPRRPPSQSSFLEEPFSHSDQPPLDDLPVPSTPKPTHSPHTNASPISIPTRNSARPPVIQSLAASRLSTPVPPRIQSGAHRADPISIPTPIATPSRSAPMTGPSPALRANTIPIPSHSSAQNHTLISTPANPPAEAGISISDAQIDPALLQAITTVLQNANQPESQPSQYQEEPSLTQTVPEEAESQTRPASRGRRRASAKQTTEGVDPSSSTATTPRPRRASRRSSNTEAGEEQSGEENEQNHKPRRRKRASTSSSTPRKRRSRAPSVPPYDAEADPGEELDPTAVTMAELCDDTGRGRVSSKAAQIVTNHAAWRASNREKRARMRAMMEAKKYGRSEEEGTTAPENDAAATETPSGEASATQPTAEVSTSRAQSTEAGQPEAQKGNDFDYSQAVTTSRYNVQVRIGPNGEAILDETSLYVDRQEEEDTANYTHVEESDTTKFVNSMSYSKKLRGSRWSAEETELFFDALSQFGENYELISYVLPGRDRKACKNKFKIEDKRNSNRITFCLKNRRPYDMQTLARMTGKDFSGPPPEIVMPTPIRPPQSSEPPAEEAEATVKVRKQSATPGLDGGEVVEVIEEYDA